MLILFFGMFASMASGGALDSIDLNAYQWKHRLLFLFVPSENDLSYLSLKEEIEHQAKEVLDRDLLVVHVPEKGEGRFGEEVRRGELKPKSEEAPRNLPVHASRAKQPSMEAG